MKETNNIRETERRREDIDYTRNGPIRLRSEHQSEGKLQPVSYIISKVRIIYSVIQSLWVSLPHTVDGVNDFSSRCSNAVE